MPIQLASLGAGIGQTKTGAVSAGKPGTLVKFADGSPVPIYPTRADAVARTNANSSGSFTTDDLGHVPGWVSDDWMGIEATVTIPPANSINLILGLTGPQGVQGNPGIGANWRGQWSAVTTYAVGDGVARNGFGYVSATAGNLNHDPAADLTGTNWTNVYPLTFGGSVTTNPFITGLLKLRDHLHVKDFGMSWNGTDESAKFFNAVQFARQNNLELELPEGQTIVTETLTDLTDTTNSLRLRGQGRGKTTILDTLTSSPLFELLGGGLTTITTLTAPLAAGIQQLTGLNSVTGISAGDFLLLRDTNSGVSGSGGESGGSNNSVVSYNGEWVRVFSVDSTTPGAGKLTIYGPIRWSYTTGTTVLRLAYIDAPSFRDFKVFNPNPRTGTGAARGILLNYVRRPHLTGLAFEQMDAPSIYQQWVLSGMFSDIHFKDLEDDAGTSAARLNPGGAGGVVTTGSNPYGIVFGRACQGGLVQHCFQQNGRHMVTTVSAFDGTNTSEIGPQVILVTDCLATEMFHAAFDCHPGARWVTFMNCKVFSTAWDGFQIRSPDCSVINPVVIGANRGVFVNYGADRTKILGGRLQQCNIGVDVLSSEDVKIGGDLAIESPTTNGILYETPDASWPGHVTKGEVDNIEISGTPSDAGIRFQANAFPTGYRIGRNVRIPDAGAKKILGAPAYLAPLASAPASLPRDATVLRGLLTSNVLWESLSRKDLSIQTVSGPASGTLNVFRVYIPKGLPITSMGMVSGNQAAVGPTHWWFSLYDYNLAPLIQTADGTTTAWAASTPKDQLVTGGPYTTPYDGMYFWGVVITTSTTQPNFMGNLQPQSNMGQVIAATTTNTGLTVPAVINPPTGLSERSGYPLAYIK